MFLRSVSVMGQSPTHRRVGRALSRLDIAPGPVAMVNHRLRQLSLPGEAQQGSILDAPFPDSSFDFVIAIGCLHRTGDLKKSIEECHRILRPGGKLIFMVYYAYSYRRIFQQPRETLRYVVRGLLGRRNARKLGARMQGVHMVSILVGDVAPYTDWISKRSLRHLCHNFSTFSAVTENIDNGPPYKKARSRRELLMTRWPRFWGLDLYATAVK